MNLNPVTLYSSVPTRSLLTDRTDCAANEPMQRYSNTMQNPYAGRHIYVYRYTDNQTMPNAISSIY